MVFKYAYDAGLIDKTVHYGPTFKQPAKSVLRKVRNGSGTTMFEAADISAMLAAASVQITTMILLGVNCGFGNHDCGLIHRAVLTKST